MPIPPSTCSASWFLPVLLTDQEWDALSLEQQLQAQTFYEQCMFDKIYLRAALMECMQAQATLQHLPVNPADVARLERLIEHLELLLLEEDAARIAYLVEAWQQRPRHWFNRL